MKRMLKINFEGTEIDFEVPSGKMWNSLWLR